jgi:cyclopropane fatty-acyl-phospholipid synthase-like methyltransferase
MKYPDKIKDECRENLCKYLIKALSYTSIPDHAQILDLGCGSGVPAIALSKHTKGYIHALDSDRNALDVLSGKISRLHLWQRFHLIHSSIPETNLSLKSFDLIVAEGILNVIGFSNGLDYIDGLIRSGGFVIIHDEWKDHEIKCNTFSDKGFRLIHSFRLDNHIWFKRYIQCMEKKIMEFPKEFQSGHFTNERNDIQMYHNHPELFTSVYYVLQKED